MKNNVLEFKRPPKPKKKMPKDLGKRIATGIFFILLAFGLYLVTQTSFGDLAPPPPGRMTPE
jgi:hypothetical protein